MRKLGAGILSLTLVSLVVLVCFPAQTSAATLLQIQTGQIAPGTSVSATLTAATSGNMIIVICGAPVSTTLSISTAGFSTAINETGTSSQGIFYKVSIGGETTITCASTVSARLGIQVYEYSGMITTSPIDGTPGSSTGTSTSASSGSTTTTTSDVLLIAGVTVVGNNAFSAWSNTFTERADFVNTGANASRGTYGGSDRQVTSAGTYTTTGTLGVSLAWRGQIVAFKAIIGSLSVDIVDSAGTSVGSPTVGMSALNSTFNCQTPTGTLGVSAQRIRVRNTTSNAQWTVSIAASGGATDSWSDGGTNNYDFNDAAGTPAGCGDGADADTLAGRMTINPSVATSTPQSGCTNTGVTLGTSTAFAQGTTNSITVINASTSAAINCYWDVTGVAISQTVPAEQRAGSYSLSLTLTVAAI
ncbi:MAG: hypothetical protein M3Q14_04635 [bacterium]|nr:hypothetical protein [bacterium]